MPSKSHRAASRQTQAQRRGKRRRTSGKGRSQEFDAGPREPHATREVQQPEARAEPVSQPQTQDEAQPQAPARAQTSPRPEVAQTAQRRRSTQRAQAENIGYQYLGVELKQIGAVTAVIAAIMVALTFILGA